MGNGRYEEAAEKMYEKQLEEGKVLTEKWARMDPSFIKGFKSDTVDFLKNIDNETQRIAMARIFENTQKWLVGMEETVRTNVVGSFEKFIFPLLRAVMANLVASELVTVSPLGGPTGMVFYLDAVYGSSKGTIAQGSHAYDVRTGPSLDQHYSDEIINQEPLGTGDGATTQFGAGDGAFAWTPIRAGTVNITDGSQNIHDDMNGNLLGDINAAGVNTVNYASGIYDVTFAAAPANGDAVTVTYEYDSEANQTLPEIEIKITSAPVTCRRNVLVTKWSMEAQQDFRAYHGISADVELTNIMANLISKEINYKIINQVRQVASSPAGIWDQTPPAGVQWALHKLSLYDALVRQSNGIYLSTQRAQGNWIVAATDVCSIFEVLPNFKSAGKQKSGLAGIIKSGTLGEFDIYKHPGFTASTWLMGHKGSNFLDTGFIHAPYLMLYTIPPITLEDMVTRKAMASRTAQKVVNSRMYSLGSMIASGATY